MSLESDVLQIMVVDALHLRRQAKSGSVEPDMFIMAAFLLMEFFKR